MKRTRPTRFKLNRLAAALVLSLTTATAVYAAGMGDTSVTLTNENPSATNVDYTFEFNPATTGSTIRRVEFQVGTTQGGSTVPTDMDTTGASLGTVSGLSGTWTEDVSVNGTMEITNGTGSTPTNPVSVELEDIENSSVEGTYYVRISTYDATSGGNLIDQDDLAFPIESSTVTVSAAVGQTLSFALSSTAVNLGTLSSGSVATGNHTMTVGTNASGGYAITGQGTTLTSGSDTIPFVTDGTVTAGASEYGVAFAGAAGHPAGDQDLSSSTTVASASGPVSSAVTTATYKASITGSQPAGSYTSAITYIATATF
ncbi:MAG: hypothetical protein M3N59_01640 [bacterium]|nr:hypothetical protein [bacterium]